MSLFLDGLDLQPGDRRWYFFLTDGIDELPAVRGASLVVPFRSGRRYPARVADTRKLVLTGHVKATDLRAAIDELKAVLSPTDAQRQVTWEDPLGHADPRWTNAIVLNVVADRAGPSARKYSIELEADPYWIAPWHVIPLDGGYLMDGGWSMDESSPLTVTPASEDETVAIPDLGTAPTDRITVTITGPSVSAVGVQTAGGIGFVMDAALAGGETLVFDAYERTVAINGVNARASLNLAAGNELGEWLTFAKTSETIHVLGQPVECELQWRNQYL